MDSNDISTKVLYTIVDNKGYTTLILPIEGVIDTLKMLEGEKQSLFVCVLHLYSIDPYQYIQQICEGFSLLIKHENFSGFNTNQQMNITIGNSSGFSAIFQYNTRELLIKYYNMVKQNKLDSNVAVLCLFQEMIDGVEQ